jgi:hypothetical protein
MKTKIKIKNWKNERVVKRKWNDYEFTFIKTNYYEKINHLINDWSSN